jgi:TolB-like protein/DNA-binding winged helix-turn-helix (wHTH) protein
VGEYPPIPRNNRLTSDSNARVRFGSFEVDLRTGELRKRGLKIKLHGQPFDVLTVLLERPGEVVTREELQQKLWSSETFVDFERGLNKAINRLREALSDVASNPRYIETLPRQGYRFIGAIVPDEIQSEQKQSLMGRWTKWLSAAALFVIAAALLMAYAGGLPSKILSRLATRPPIRSIAVLPLISLSSDKEQDYFTEGMTEALITELGKISALRVISHQSAMHYKGTKKSVPQIARELTVDAIVEGSIIRAGDQVRISVQLIDGRIDRHLWAENYQREVREILSLQEDVAKAIAAEVKVKLTPQEEELLTSATQVGPEAHEAYLKGRYYLNRWPEAESTNCIEAFQTAIDKEPNFADADAGLATCYALMPWHFPPKDVLPKAKIAAQRALNRDPNQAEAFVALGFVNMFYDWDWHAAEQNVRKAMELNPNRAFSRLVYSNYFVFTGRSDDAIREAKKAVEQDPVSILMNRNLAFVYQLAHKYKEYEAQARATLQLAPSDFLSNWDLAWAYALQGKKGEALERLNKGIYPIDRPIVLATLGEREQALLELKALEKQCPSGCSFWLASGYALAAKSDKAIHLLEQAYQERDPAMPQLKTNPALDSLRPDPRFQDLVRRVNFPE